MRIDFAVIGTQKGGTTALHKFLSQHPDLFLPTPKELHFFDRDRLFGKVPRPLLYAWYHSRFRGAAGTQLKGEATPIYLYWKRAVERMQAYNPRLKLIGVLRDPAERAFSHYEMLRRRGQEHRSFDQAVREEVAALRDGPRQQRLYSYVERGFYADQIEFVLKYFDQAQLLLLRSEDLWGKHEETLGRVCDFLGVRHIAAARERVFSSESGATMSPESRAFLVEQFAPDVRRLETLLGWDCSAWIGEREPASGLQEAN